MSANGLTFLVGAGGVVIAIVLVALIAFGRFRRRFDADSNLEQSDPEAARSLREIQDQIERGQNRL